MKMTFKLLSAALLTAAALAGCGGGGGSDVPATPSNSVNALVVYLQELIAGTSDSTDPIDINELELATDNTAEPSAI
jgi:predicted small lipoprotein YifL